MIGAEIRKFQEGHPVNLKKLKTIKDTWRLAVGEWRVIMETREGNEERIFEVINVIKRKDAYR